MFFNLQKLYIIAKKLYYAFFLHAQKKRSRVYWNISSKRCSFFAHSKFYAFFKRLIFQIAKICFAFCSFSFFQVQKVWIVCFELKNLRFFFRAQKNKKELAFLWIRMHATKPNQLTTHRSRCFGTSQGCTGTFASVCSPTNYKCTNAKNIRRRIDLFLTSKK